MTLPSRNSAAGSHCAIVGFVLCAAASDARTTAADGLIDRCFYPTTSKSRIGTGQRFGRSYRIRQTDDPFELTGQEGRTSADEAGILHSAGEIVFVPSGIRCSAAEIDLRGRSRLQMERRLGDRN